PIGGLCPLADTAIFVKPVVQVLRLGGNFPEWTGGEADRLGIDGVQDPQPARFFPRSIPAGSQEVGIRLAADLQGPTIELAGQAIRAAPGVEYHLRQLAGVMLILGPSLRGDLPLPRRPLMSQDELALRSRRKVLDTIPEEHLRPTRRRVQELARQVVVE